MFNLCSLIFCVLSTPCLAEVLAGPVRVIDADTIDVGAGPTIRLLGIDAPEGDQTCRRSGGGTVPCGALATQAVRSLYGGRYARCEVRDTDRYGRALAVCTVDGQDMNAELVSRGLARIYRDDLTYAEEQKAAILFERGLWAYEMQDPAAWRAARRAAPQPAPEGCAIKGNISEAGRIYHIPGSRSYDRTRINTKRGERWFCSEGEARAAGWRAPGA